MGIQAKPVTSYPHTPGRTPPEYGSTATNTTFARHRSRSLIEDLDGVAGPVHQHRPPRLMAQDADKIMPAQ